MEIPQILIPFLKKKGPSLLAQAHLVAQADIQAVAAVLPWGSQVYPTTSIRFLRNFKNRAVI